jgi:hypothetical protein
MPASYQSGNVGISPRNVGDNMLAMSTRFSTAAAIAALFFLATCEDNPSTSQTAARDEATQHMCDRAQACGLIGAGLTYQTRDDCVVRWQADWQNAWPPAQCDGHIDSTQLNACLTNIDAIQCSDLGAGLVAIALTCGAARVCSANR